MVFEKGLKGDLGVLSALQVFNSQVANRLNNECITADCRPISGQVRVGRGPRTMKGTTRADAHTVLARKKFSDPLCAPVSSFSSS